MYHPYSRTQDNLLMNLILYLTGRVAKAHPKISIKTCDWTSVGWGTALVTGESSTRKVPLRAAKSWWSSWGEDRNMQVTLRNRMAERNMSQGRMINCQINGWPVWWWLNKMMYVKCLCLVRIPVAGCLSLTRDVTLLHFRHPRYTASRANSWW